MKKVTLGRTGIAVPQNAFGALPVQRVPKQQAVYLLQKAYDGGMRLFDTARAYTDSEEKLGEAFGTGFVQRDRIIITTKTHSKTPEAFRKDLDASLRLLKTDYIDVYQLHNVPQCYKPGDGTEYATVEDDVPCDFALIAEGDSMTGDRIFSGDMVFIRAQDHVQDGEIAAVAVDDEITLKRVRRLRQPDGRVAFTQLLPSNPRYAPIEIGGEDETRNVRIIGKAVAVRFGL